MQIPKRVVLFFNNYQLLLCNCAWHFGEVNCVIQDKTITVLYAPIYFLARKRNNRSTKYAVRFATHKYGNNYAVMQGDGNFVVYNSNNQPLWHSNTWGNPGAFLNVQTDGNLVVYSSALVPLWNIGADMSPEPIVDSPTPAVGNPSNVGDVVGRDLDYPGLGWLGHLGIWNGGKIAEVVNGNANAIRFTSLSNFVGTSAYWGRPPQTSLITVSILALNHAVRIFRFSLGGKRR